MRGSDLVFEDGRTKFTAIIEEEEVEVDLPVYGMHMAMNALAALAVAYVKGISLKAAANKLSYFESFKNRQQIYNIKGYQIIDDTYNASPDSVKAALDVISRAVCKGKKIAVLADMLELGTESPVFHYETGEIAGASEIDLLITIGDMALHIARGFRTNRKQNKSWNDDMVLSFSDNNQAAECLEKIIKDNDLVLFKGSNGMKLYDLIEKLKEVK
jgi:UDP-N-acetylmuramoyl-tripeptide--D-alanyl-D-alanine ligase